LEHEFYFPFHIWDVILPIDELIFFRGVGIPPISSLCPEFVRFFIKLLWNHHWLWLFPNFEMVIYLQDSTRTLVKSPLQYRFCHWILIDPIKSLWNLYDITKLHHFLSLSPWHTVNSHFSIFTELEDGNIYRKTHQIWW
jgi:hypothetical protein